MIHCAIVYCCLLLVAQVDSAAPEDKRTYEAAAATAGRDALAHIRLASWCEIHGMHIERHKHLGIASSWRRIIRRSMVCLEKLRTTGSGGCRRL